MSLSLTTYLNAVNGSSFLSWPLRKFYINSSHNSFLASYQVGNSSATNTRSALATGARHIELDIHRLGALINAANIDLPNSTPIVVHGNDSVVDVSYSHVKDHFQVIKEFGFLGTDDPLLLQLEIFDAEDTEMMIKLGELIRQYFGDRLWKGTMDKLTWDGYLPNAPIGELRNKIGIIINYYNMNRGTPVPGKTYNVGLDNRNKYLFPVVHATTDEPDNGWFNSGHIMKGISSATAATPYAGSKLYRVYPDNGLGSSNYRPVRYWGNKFSFVSLNSATTGWNLTANKRFFASCNIVPKGTYINKASLQLVAANEWYGMDMYENGNFVAPTGADSIVILPNTAYCNGCSWFCKTFELCMQGDGNLVIYTGKTPTWASNTSGNAGAILKVQNDNNLVIVRKADGAPIWASNTYRDTAVGGGAVFNAIGSKGALEVYHADGTLLRILT